MLNVLNLTLKLMTKPLSPAARAVLDAAVSVCHPETEVVAFQCTRLEVAAALRAAADQVVPETEEPRNQLEYELGDWDARDDVRDALLAIAAELEGGND
jgi:hypothetical protein